MKRGRPQVVSETPFSAERSEESISAGNPSLFSCPKRILALCLAFRAANSLLVRTYFNPDEHWQSLEVAHHVVFGYGHLTWEWKKGIRSYLHPLIFALLYKVLEFCRMDSPWFMMRTPRLLQSIFSSFGDLYLYKLSRLIFNERVARWALFCQWTNWFMFFCSTRTLSNSLEAALTMIGLFYWWPSLSGSSKPSSSSSRKLALAVAALACAVRPTSAITWLYIGILDLFKTHNRIKFLLLEVIPIGTVVFGVTSLLDRWMYGSWVFVPLNFLKFNFLSSGGDYYGTHSWHWYFTQGFSVMLFSFIPFTIVGICQSKEWKLSGLIAWVLGLYSVLGHKEFRFVLPVLPVALIFSGYSLEAIENLDTLDSRRKGSMKLHVFCLTKMQLAIFFLLVTNLPMALYMSLIHQRGSEDVTNFLAEEALHGRVDSVLFLMPCHATPYYSTVHQNLSMRFLDCSPSDDKGSLDESDRFMTDPVGFVSSMARNWSLPSHIVMFDAEARQLKEFLTLHSFIEIERFFHAHFKVDRDLQAAVVVYAWQGK